MDLCPIVSESSLDTRNCLLLCSRSNTGNNKSRSSLLLYWCSITAYCYYTPLCWLVVRTKSIIDYNNCLHSTTFRVQQHVHMLPNKHELLTAHPLPPKPYYYYPSSSVVGCIISTCAIALPNFVTKCTMQHVYEFGDRTVSPVAARKLSRHSCAVRAGGLVLVAVVPPHYYYLLPTTDSSSLQHCQEW